MAYRIELTTVSDKLEALWPLLVQHRDELTTDKEHMVLKPDVEQYRQHEAAGRIFALVAYHGDQVVGYSINFVGRNLHYADLGQAHNDVLFVHPEHRGGRLGMQLIVSTEQHAASLGAKLMLWHAKARTQLEQLMPRMGYRVQDVIFSKILED